MPAKKSELEKAKKAAIISSEKKEEYRPREFGSEDILKHYIRNHFWKKRIRALKRDIKPELDNGIKYFSLCSKSAFDIRFFVKENLINTNNFQKKVYFCESNREDYDFLMDYFITKYFPDNGKGFYGELANIAIKPQENDYSNFWGSFPFDVINLDYYGDIFKTNPREVGVDEFHAINLIISQQSRLMRPYELWITFRAREARVAPKVQQAFKSIIEYNLENFKDTFGRKFNERFPGINNTSEINIEDQCYIGILKWLSYVCSLSSSAITQTSSEVLKYTRTDKDGNEYNVYNILLRIKPFDAVEIPSPASNASKWSADEYKKGVISCFKKPIDIDRKFNKLNNRDKEKLNKELKSLDKDYGEDKKGLLLKT